MRAVDAAPVVIADGHHRYETALTYQAERRAARDGAPGDYDLVMAFVVELSEGQLSVGPIHRTLSGVPADVDLAEFFGRWFDIVHAGPADDQLVEAVAESGALALVTERGVWLLTPREQTYAEAGSDLDSSLVALATDAIPDVDGDLRPRLARRRRRRSPPAGPTRPCCCGPSPSTRSRDWAHSRQRMPPKSTYFYPKPRTGMVFRTRRGLEGRAERRALRNTGAAARPLVAADGCDCAAGALFLYPPWGPPSHVPPQDGPEVPIGGIGAAPSTVETPGGRTLRPGDGLGPGAGGSSAGLRPRAAGAAGLSPRRSRSRPRRAGRRDRRAPGARWPRASWRVMAVAVVGALDGAEHADRCRFVGAPRQAGKLEGEPGLVPALVVDEQGVLAHVGHLGDAQPAVGLHDHPVLLLGAEADGLAVDERDQDVGAGVLGR